MESISMRKRLLGLEPQARICVPESPLWYSGSCHTGYFAYSGFLNGPEGMFLCNTPRPPPAANSPAVKWFRTEMSLSELYFTSKGWVAIALEPLSPQTSFFIYIFQCLGVNSSKPHGPVHPLPGYPADRSKKRKLTSPWFSSISDCFAFWPRWQSWWNGTVLYYHRMKAKL